MVRPRPQCFDFTNVTADPELGVGNGQRVRVRATARCWSAVEAGADTQRSPTI
jgi:hypothetical protein